MMTVVYALLVFVPIIVALSLLLVLAEATLLDYGECTVDINGDPDRALVVNGGSTLLQTLFRSKIFIPSACGGKGSCGYCKVKINEGGGDLLPTELGLLSRKEVKAGVRISCQCKVRKDMRIEIPDEFLSIQQYDGKVKSNDNVATFIKEFVVALPEGERLKFQAGQYVQIHVPKFKAAFKDFAIGERYIEDYGKYGLLGLNASNDDPELMRAYSMANHPGEDDVVMLNVRIATPPRDAPDAPPGVASSYIFNLKPGDDCLVSGPYGDFLIKETGREMLYLGGGAGMAPMRSHIFHLFKGGEPPDRKVTFWYGARSMREIFYQDEFQEISDEHDNFDFTIALSSKEEGDDWQGPEGFIHQVCWDEYLSKHPDPASIDYYLCGPPVMDDAVTTMLHEAGVPDDNISFDAC